jgi:D-alanyl-lipoteichoic acid acyltransferase DltB (MBOAT superfamily)
VSFSSLTFLIFLAVVFTAYWLLRQRKSQNLLLVLASYTFYGWWDWRFCGLMLLSSSIDFSLGLAIQKAEQPRWRRTWLVASLVFNLSLLGFFKYYNFFASSFADAVGAFGWHPDDVTLDIILPVGISFYTFQSLSYTVDVYRRQLSATAALFDYLAFVSFFPQLVAGPIERASHLLPQFEKERRFDPEQAADGLRQMLWGLFKKLVVADRLALLVEGPYSEPASYSGTHLAFATLCFAFQIYCDFSGYSDIAIGCAKQFGIALNRNFAYPYFSQSVGEFWRRWHISLSTWFRDYVYIPLGGGRVGPAMRVRNVLITFFISGFWHGAAWTYVAWGGLHGVFTAIPARRRSSEASDMPGGDRIVPSAATFGRMLITFVIVCACWIPFRAESWADTMTIGQRIATQLVDRADFIRLGVFLSLTPGALMTVIVLAAFVAIEWLGRRKEFPLAIQHRPRAIRWGVYTVAFWATILLIPEGQGQAFIYFDF